MVNVKGRYKAHGSEQQEFCIFKKQKKQKGEPGMRTAIFPSLCIVSDMAAMRLL